jgi:serine/threonine-protein kinase
MGEVYKARDMRLDRSVAIKVLLPEFSVDPDRRARFEREAKAIAGLTHPHICTLYDVGEHDGATFLVMEHLDGHTLAHRLQKGAIPPNEVLECGAQIADALAAAHHQGVVHRDLKPGNIMLTKAGVKLLDFGLAKLRPKMAAPGASLSGLSTQAPATMAGAVMGTLPYMAPEQLEGKDTDARTDLFAFGCVLYEMITGRRAFAGETEASVISAIMTSQPPPLSSLPPDWPAGLGRLVTACLAKDPEARRQSAHDVAEDLRALLEANGAAEAATARPKRNRVLRGALLVAGALALGAFGAGLILLERPSTSRGPLAQLSMAVRPAEEVNTGGVTSLLLPAGGARTAFAWTPDGRSLVFVGRRAGIQQLYVRALEGEARPLPGTEGAQVPAVSTDGQWVAFWSNRAIRKVPVAGGPVAEIRGDVALPPWGLAWDARGGLFFGSADGPIWAIAPDGSVAATTVLGDAEIGHGMPWPLPDGRAMLYTVRKQRFTSGEEDAVALSLATRTSKLLLHRAADARFLPTGHLVFMREGTLFAVPFDPVRLEVRGTPVAMLGSVAQALIGNHAADVTSAGQFAVAPTGTLAWIPASPVAFQMRQLVTVDRQGRVSPPVTPSRSYGIRVRLAPAGRELAVNVIGAGHTGLWIHELDRPDSLSPVLRDGEATCPLWTPDGQRITFWWNKNGRRSVAWLRADGTAGPEVLAPGDFQPSSWTPDGRQLAVVNYSAGEAFIVTRGGGQSTVKPLPQAPNSQVYWPEFSPDGHWLAYGSDASGRWEVYVRPYPGPGREMQLSTDGGQVPAWRRDGRGLFFLGRDTQTGIWRMMEADFRADSAAPIGPPRRLFDVATANLAFYSFHVRAYDVAPDGQRFFVLQNQPLSPGPVVTHINVILNWFELLTSKVPIK